MIYREFTISLNVAGVYEITYPYHKAPETVSFSTAQEARDFIDEALFDRREEARLDAMFDDKYSMEDDDGQS
jgi:hypothetical protein